MEKLDRKEDLMKVMIVSRGIPSEKRPMNGIFEFDQARAIAGQGHDVIFAYMDRRSIRWRRKFGFTRYYRDGVLVYGFSLPLGGLPKKLRGYLASQALKVLYRKIEREEGRPDLIHSHFMEISNIVARTKESIGLPLVMTEHYSKLMNMDLYPGLRERTRQTYSQADRIISVSPALQAVIKSEFKIDNSYIPNVVDTSVFKYDRKMAKTTAGFTFISVGNLIYRKRMDLVVQAFDQAFGDRKEIRLIIVGEGEEREKIEKLIKEKGLEDRVRLTGKLHRREIFKLMNESDCFLLPSMAETFGVVYIEALATGLPVIASRCGGPEGFINDSNGLMVDLDDQDGLAAAMDYMYKNIDNYDREKISKDTYRQFSPESVGKMIVDVYRDLVD